MMRRGRRLLLKSLLPDSAHALVREFLALDVDGAGLARNPVVRAVGDGAVAELRMPCRRRELRAQYERPGVVPRLDGLRGLAGLVGVGLLGWRVVGGWRVVLGGLLFAARSTSLI